jgi:hypothetical protein
MKTTEPHKKKNRITQMLNPRVVFESWIQFCNDKEHRRIFC